MKMQAALWYGPEDIKVEEVQIPQIGPEEVLVKIGVALTCGTDYKLFRQGHALLVKDVPSFFGHELAGVIAEVGSQVVGFQAGDRVVAANSAPCGNCFFCQQEQWNLCENLEFLNGAYAEYIRIPARIVQKNLHKIPDHLSLREAALTEPLACVLHCMERISPKKDQTICIIGTGTCGLLFTQLSQLYGVKVITIGRGKDKLGIASNLGAHHTFSSLEKGFEDDVRKATKLGYGPDIVIDAVGQPATWELAFRLVRRGGSVCFYGGCAKGTKVTFDTYKLHYEQINCFGVFHHTPTYFAKALDIISAGKIDLKHLIIGEKKLSELDHVFYKGVERNCLKYAIIP